MLKPQRYDFSTYLTFFELFILHFLNDLIYNF
jgi:hypothetical protein